MATPQIRRQQQHRQQQLPPRNTTSSGQSFIPSGFECVAHPVFFQTQPAQATSSAEERRHSHRRLRFQPHQQHRAAASVANGVTVNASNGGGTPTGRSVMEPQHHDFVTGSSLVSSELFFETRHSTQGSNSPFCGDEGKGTSSIGSGERQGAGGSAREVDRVCPICLSKFEEPVTLTSCLHSFCHTCILGWYEHTVAVALARGGVSILRETAGSRRRGNEEAIPAPYRCPLCQVPGPYFLAVQTNARSTPLSAGGGVTFHNRKANDSDMHTPKLKFKLLGARTVLGGGREAGQEVAEAADVVGVAEVSNAGDGNGSAVVGYPTMEELRAAVRTQLALKAAMTMLEADEEDASGTTRERATDEARDNCANLEGRRERSWHRRRGLHSKDQADEESIRGRSSRRGSEKEGGEAKHLRSSPTSSKIDVPAVSPTQHDSDSDGRSERNERRKKKRGDGRRSDEDDERCTHDRGRRERGKGDASGRIRIGDKAASALLWEPGSMSAEDALRAVETMLEREKEKLLPS